MVYNHPPPFTSLSSPLQSYLPFSLNTRYCGGTMFDNLTRTQLYIFVGMYNIRSNAESM